MEEQRARGRKAQKKEAVELSKNVHGFWGPTRFIGYDQLESVGGHYILSDDQLFVELTPFYAEMGGQVGDTGFVETTDGEQVLVLNTVRSPGGVHILKVATPGSFGPQRGAPMRYVVDRGRRSAIERHHTVTHLLHWALHEVVSREAVQKGSYVGPEKLTFDFSSARPDETAGAGSREIGERKDRGERAGFLDGNSLHGSETARRHHAVLRRQIWRNVRVVQIGGTPNALDGYSMELCGGTHVRHAADIGHFRIVSEGAIAAGIRRIEAVAGDAVGEWARHEALRQDEKFQALQKKKPGITALPAFDTRDSATMVAAIGARTTCLEMIETEVREWEKENAKSEGAALQKRGAAIAQEILAAHGTESFLALEIPDTNGALLQGVAEALQSEFNGPIFLASASDERVDLVATVPKSLTNRFQAGRLIQEIAPIVQGKGGGRPELARGAGRDPSQISTALESARRLFREKIGQVSA